jgi:hypothetical protein
VSEAEQNQGQNESILRRFIAGVLTWVRPRRQPRKSHVWHDHQSYHAVDRWRDRRQRGRRSGEECEPGNRRQHDRGALGGAAGGSLLTSLIPALAGATGGMDIGALVGQLVGGGVSGAIVSAIVGLIMKSMRTA